MITHKKCKGTGKALGFGCGELVSVKKRKYGLGFECNCWTSWLLDTEKGQEHLAKVTISASRKIVKEHKKIEREKMREKKIKNMSVDKYRSTYVQPKINKIARLIDYGHPCVATETYGKMNGGHYTSVGANRTICMNLHNIFMQSFQSNHWKSGDQAKYRLGLIRIFGENYFEFVEGLRRHPSLHLTKDDLIEIKVQAEKIVKEIEEDNFVRTPIERIAKRNEVNLRLGIYEHFHSIFKI